MKRQQIIGYVLIAILFVGYFAYMGKTKPAPQTNLATQDSSARFSTDSNSTKPLVSDVLSKVQEEEFKKESQQAIYIFSTKGGALKKTELKQYLDLSDSTHKAVVFDNTRLFYFVDVNNQKIRSSDIDFVRQGSDSQIVYKALLADGQVLTHTYRIHPNNYMIDFDIQLSSQHTPNTSVVFTWLSVLGQKEQSWKYETQATRLAYYDAEKDKFDFERLAKAEDEKIKTDVAWLSFKQRFFSQTLINGEGSFKQVSYSIYPEAEHSGLLGKMSTTFEKKADEKNQIHLHYLIAPDNYASLKAEGKGLGNLVDLGSGLFAFVKYINRAIIMPVFLWLKNFGLSLGWAIALLTIFIRLITSPLIYTSYVSGAKMKALKPELDALREKTNGDQQKFAMDQMALYREAGVNPLGGCIPALLQIPIFFALYSFFNSMIDLRGVEFLWAKDLASYDVIAHLPFYVWGYGDHVSLFTLSAATTSFLISLYGMTGTPTADPNNPMLKYMPYIFPFVLLFVFNNMPAALTWYYTISNLISLLMQFVIQRYIINHDKILATISDNKKKKKSKSKWQLQLEQIQNMKEKNKAIKKN